jgi:hypothetical protein
MQAGQRARGRAEGDSDPLAGLLPADWSFTGKDVLELEPEIVVAQGEPPLSAATESLDLVLAGTAFTTLAESWSAWLVELHRILRPGGLVVADFLDPRTLGEAVDDPTFGERIGMHVRNHHFGMGRGGPQVVLSEWWIREHWGRAFDVLRLAQRDRPGESVAVLRKRDAFVTVAGLEALRADEPREFAALRENLRSLHADARHLAARAEAYGNNLSWRLSRPLRVANRLRGGRA